MQSKAFVFCWCCCISPWHIDSKYAGFFFFHWVILFQNKNYCTGSSLQSGTVRSLENEGIRYGSGTSSLSLVPHQVKCEEVAVHLMIKTALAILLCFSLLGERMEQQLGSCGGREISSMPLPCLLHPTWVCHLPAGPAGRRTSVTGMEH